MTRLPIVLAIVSALGGAVLWQRATIADLTAENAAVTRDLAVERAYRAQAEEAAAVHRAHIKRLEREAVEWAELTRDLQSMEGRDAPLSDHMRDAAGRVWP